MKLRNLSKNADWSERKLQANNNQMVLVKLALVQKAKNLIWKEKKK